MEVVIFWKCLTFLVTVSCSCQFAISSTFQTTFSKNLATADPDASSLVVELVDPASEQITSFLECANYASIKAQSQRWEERCSAFKFENNSCTLAKTPPFIDKLIDKGPVAKGTEGYYIPLEKPLCKYFLTNHIPMLKENSKSSKYLNILDHIWYSKGSLKFQITARIVHSDLVAYILINEEKYFNAHDNLPNPPKEKYYNGTTKRFDFNKESPVQTKEGHLAGTPVNKANLYMKLDKPQILTEISVSIWYNTGTSLPTETEGLFLLRNTSSSPHGPVDSLQLDIDAAGKLAIRIRLYESMDIFHNFPALNDALNPDVWYYITTTYNIGTGEGKLYLNGTEILSENGPHHSGYFSPKIIRIGKAFEYFMSGYLASFEVYDRVLTSTEIADAMMKSTTYRVGM